MDFELTNRQKQIRLAAREFAEGELMPLGKDVRPKANIQRDHQEGSSIGFRRCLYQEEYGGLGLGSL